MPPAALALQQVKGAPADLLRPGRATCRSGWCPCPAKGLSIPWQVPIQEAVHRFGQTKVLQGNLDPSALLAGKEIACRKARVIVDEMRDYPHIFNLGHGILPETDPEVLAAVIEEVKRGAA